MVRAIWKDDSDRLWAIGATADRNWQTGLGHEKRLEGQVAYPIEDELKVFDGIIDVFDLRRKRLIVSQRLPETYNQFVGSISREGSMSRIRASGVLAACVLLVVGFGRSRSTEMNVWATRGTLFEKAHCANCEYCASYGVDHRAPLFDSATLGGAHDWCMQIVCSHPECSVCARIPGKDKHPEDLEKLLIPAWHGDMTALGELVARFPERIVLNEERNVVQLIACSGGGISGQLPVSRTELSLLQASMSLASR